VALAALQASVYVTKSKLADQRVIIYGAGSAGMGIAKGIRDSIVLKEGKQNDVCLAGRKAFHAKNGCLPPCN
jgi:malic enzyme